MRLRRVRINAAGYLNRCELGPSVVFYPEGVWYGSETKEDVDQILEIHLLDGGCVDHLKTVLKTAEARV